MATCASVASGKQLAPRVVGQPLSKLRGIMQEPTIIEFSQRLADACNSIEHSIAQMTDALRWRACLKHGFPSRNHSASTADMRWTVKGEFYGRTPTDAIDAILREQCENGTLEPIS
jgi:hypothetical protein